MLGGPLRERTCRQAHLHDASASARHRWRGARLETLTTPLVWLYLGDGLGMVGFPHRVVADLEVDVLGHRLDLRAPAAERLRRAQRVLRTGARARDRVEDRRSDQETQRREGFVGSRSPFMMDVWTTNQIAPSSTSRTLPQSLVQLRCPVGPPKRQQSETRAREDKRSVR